MGTKITIPQSFSSNKVITHHQGCFRWRTMITCRAGLAQSVQRRTRGWPAGVRFLAGVKILHIVQTGSRAHPNSYTMGTRDCFTGGKAAEAWSWPLTLIWCRGQEWWSYISILPYVIMAWCFSMAHSNSYTVGTGGCFPRVKATWAWSWPFSSI
jgi:hypothetical protein